MENSKTSDQLSAFLDTGIYRFERPNVVFMDPVRVLNRSYTRFRVSPSEYYSRVFESKYVGDCQKTPTSSTSKKRKRKPTKSRALNDRERAADQRHQKVRSLLIEAQRCLMGATDLLAIMRDLRTEFCCSRESRELNSAGDVQSFIELGRVWQAPLYQITLNFLQQRKPFEDEGSLIDQHGMRRVFPVFNNFVVNETDDDVEAEFLDRKYIIPRESSFYMSDLGQICDIIPADSDCGFSLIVVDPPWENASAHQKLLYPTLPNRYFLSLPIKQLTHADGALVALWVTNREKLRDFVEKELFPMWGVSYAATLYWLKVRLDGSLISDLDLLHHRPYECLLLGYCHRESMDSKQPSSLRLVKDDHIILSIPGDYSRKPPVGELLKEHVPGLKPARCIELFAREMIAGWTSWGNEPLHFQESCCFSERYDG